MECIIWSWTFSGLQIPLQSEKFKESVVSCLLKEINQACPSFPTQKMYTILKEKQDEEVIEETGACWIFKSEIDWLDVWSKVWLVPCDSVFLCKKVL